MPTLGHGAGHDVLELGAALILVIGGAVLVALSLRGRKVLSGPTGSTIPRTSGVPSPSVQRSLVVVLAGLSGGAATIHLAAAPAHLEQLGPAGAGFLAAAAFQAAWAVGCLGRPSRRLLALGIAANLALIGAWAWTRTVGLHLPSLAGVPEPIGLADGAAVVFEILLVAGSAARLLGLDPSAGGRERVRTVASIAVVPVLGLVLIIASLAAVSLIAEPGPGGEFHGTGSHGAGQESAARP